MHGQVAAVAEDDRIRVFRLVVVANGAFRIFRRKGVALLWDVFRLFRTRNSRPSAVILSFGLRRGNGKAARRGLKQKEKKRAYEVKPLFLDLVHDDFEQLVRDGRVTVFLPVGVEHREPDLVCGSIVVEDQSACFQLERREGGGKRRGKKPRNGRRRKGRDGPCSSMSYSTCLASSVSMGSARENRGRGSGREVGEKVSHTSCELHDSRLIFD